MRTSCHAAAMLSARAATQVALASSVLCPGWAARLLPGIPTPAHVSRSCKHA